VLQSGALAQLISSDDGRMIIQARPPIILTDPNIRLRVDGTAPIETATQLKFRVEGHSTGIPISAVLEVIHMFNFDTGQYEEVSRRPSTPSDRVTEVTIAVDAARFIQSGTRLMRSRVSYFDIGVFSPAWVARIDETTWQHTP